MDNPVRLLRDRIADLIRVNASFRRDYEACWNAKKGTRQRPDGSWALRKSEGDTISATFRKSRQESEATLLLLNKVLYSSYDWCQKAVMDMRWVDGILEKVRQLADDLMRWRYWIEDPAPPARVNHRLPHPPANPAYLVYRSPNELVRDHIEFENRSYELTRELAKLLAAAGEVERIRFDRATFTVTVDGVSHSCIEPEAYDYFKRIYLGGNRKINAAEIVGATLNGVEGSNVSAHVSKTLRKLPDELKKLHKSSTKGHWIELPPIPKRS